MRATGQGHFNRQEDFSHLFAFLATAVNALAGVSEVELWLGAWCFWMEANFSPSASSINGAPGHHPAHDPAGSLFLPGWPLCSLFQLIADSPASCSLFSAAADYPPFWLLATSAPL